ncbi:hypothetical protein NDU88_007239 [Pleurodeles waltl]|uniref:Uncharacterized protein n=1 Tax=Pleurodeles waltl TaxID=8319 RepID=A0AAV7MPP7_PLEWA|nr:hypothetical protein NDU88_007239 [Pleurodeles waltl]
MRVGRSEQLLGLLVLQETGDDGTGLCLTVLAHQTHAACSLELQRGSKVRHVRVGRGVPEEAFDIWPIHAFRKADEADIDSAVSVF